MVMYPDAQKKAQHELDVVVGPDRLPDFSDRDSLPYINAVVKEIIRWHTVVPLGVSHRVADEDEYKGYRIPAGTVLVPNAWYVPSCLDDDIYLRLSLDLRAMSHDPQVYPDPDAFVPERFMEDGKCGSKARDPERYQFGFGRRCVMTTVLRCCAD